MDLQSSGSVRGPATLGGIVVAACTAVAVAAVTAIPWLRQEFVGCAIGGVVAALLLARWIRGWVGEAAALGAAVLALAIAFHWAPVVLALAMDASDLAGLAFTVPIVIWDAVRLVAPFWFAARVVSDPRDAWLPAGLAAVVTEAVVPGVFPWKLGYTLAAWPVTLQAVDLFGPEWSTFALFATAGAVVAVASAALVWCGRGHLLGIREAAGRAWTPVGAAAVAVAVANVAYGAWAMAAWGRSIEAAPKMRVALVQADPAGDGGVADLQRLTRDACRDTVAVDLVCWPECSGGSYEESLRSFTDTDLLERHSRDPIRPLEMPVCPLLFGGQVYRGLREKPLDIFQAAILMDRSETLLGTYRKRYLMPFGEYVPGARQFPELRQVFPLAEEFSTGSEATVLQTDGAARLGVLLCYEDMVSPAASSLVRGGANLLVSLINGSFFTEPLTLVQHRLLAQLRAVENRRCLVRCAATGETCVISPLGVVDDRLPLHAVGVLTADVPLLETVTPASRFWPAFPVACAVVLAAAVGPRLRPGRPASSA